MSEDARVYTRRRVPVLETIDGKVETDRLWRNLLSSQPLAFSVAGHLQKHRSAAVHLMSVLTRLPVASLTTLCAESDDLAAYKLDGIEAEWFPPRSEHTGDMSGCDIAACLELNDGRRVLVTIEVKYTDTFSAKPVDWDRYSTHLIALDLDRAETEALVKAGCSQVLRQVMITDSVRRRGLVRDVRAQGRVDDVIAVVLAREDDATAKRVVDTLHKAVGTVVPVHFWSHRHVLEEAARVKGLSVWAQQMSSRYVG